MKPIIENKEASAVPVILFVTTIIVIGALYTLFFLEIGFPMFRSWIPASDSKTFIIMCIYAIPLFILIIGIISTLKEALKPKYGVYP